MPRSPHRLFLALCRRVAFAFFGVLNGTEVNPEFEAQVGDDAECTPTLLTLPAGLSKTLTFSLLDSSDGRPASPACGQPASPTHSLLPLPTQVAEALMQGSSSGSSGKPRPLIIYCALGGQLDFISGTGAGADVGSGTAGSTAGGASGGGASRKMQTRSMMAAYQLLQGGVLQGGGALSVLRGGYGGWVTDGRDVE